MARVESRHLVEDIHPYLVLIIEMNDLPLSRLSLGNVGASMHGGQQAHHFVLLGLVAHEQALSTLIEIKIGATYVSFLLSSHIKSLSSQRDFRIVPTTVLFSPSIFHEFY